MPTMRPEIRGTRHVVSTGHYYASQAAFQMLEDGGNAIDAGVCAGIALGVLQSDLVSVGGVAPIIVYIAESQEIVTISGLGWWPRAASVEYFHREHGGAIPSGHMRTVVPAAPDAWIAALQRWGTRSFGEVAHAAIRFAREGFPMNHLLRNTVSTHIDEYRAFPASAAIYLRDDEPYGIGEIFRQTDTAAALQYMVDQERTAAHRGRAAGLRAARDAFYRGDIARKIADHHAEVGGWLTMQDLAEYASGIEAPESVRFGDIDVYSCGPWCQGPALLQALNIVERFDVRGMGHNSPAYVHTLTEAIKLVMADRDCYYSDPRFIEVPMAQLLAKDYATRRAALVDPQSAWLEMPPAGGWRELGLPHEAPVPKAPEPRSTGTDGAALDTTYLCVVDGQGNVFSATPSDGSYNGGIVPGLGFVVSGRGTQSWTDPSHPSVLAPGKRPRLTPNPAIAVQRGERFVPLGTPGGDVQIQAMLQTLLNLFVFEMGPQEAVEAPRFASYSFPNSFEPHDYHPGLLKLEARIPESVGAALERMGHRIEWWPEMVWLAGLICMIDADHRSGLLSAGADPRRMAYALGW